MHPNEFQFLVDQAVANLAARDVLFSLDGGSFAHLLCRTFFPSAKYDSAAAERAQEQHELCDKLFGPPRHGGVWMPLSAGKRTLNTSSEGALIASKLDGELIASLTPYCGVIAKGARVITQLKDGKFSLPRVETGASVKVTLEGNAPAAGDPTFDQCTLVPFTISASVPISKKLITQNTFGQAAFLEQALSGDIQRRAFAELDRVVLAGTGINEPKGILNNTDVAVYAAGTDGAAPTLDNLSDIEYQLGVNYSGGPLTWFTNSAVRRKVRRTPTAAGLSPLWNSSNQLLGYDTAITEHIPSDLEKGESSDLSAAILGDFAKVVIGIWAPAFNVVVNPYGNVSGTVTLTAFLDCGFGLLRNEAFINCADLLTT
jgi:HK97 family phage major capsid protein